MLREIQCLLKLRQRETGKGRTTTLPVINYSSLDERFLVYSLEKYTSAFHKHINCDRWVSDMKVTPALVIVLSVTQNLLSPACTIYMR